MGERWRILVVDDDKDVLELIRIKLADEYDVLCIDQATDVSLAAQLFEPDLIILDIMLPRISGYQVMDFLKHNPLTAKIPVCFLSAKSSARDLKYGYGLGASFYLTKPFQPERLLRNIKLQFERTPPPHQRKRLLIPDINQQFQTQGKTYWVATSASDVPPTPATETPASKPEKNEAPYRTPPPVEDDPRARAHWVD
ncbi:response regulator [Candidatus Sumerlaeota bacterium]|nr:response regulator [Candidatus Sumerlaeota bacterium]